MDRLSRNGRQWLELYQELRARKGAGSRGLAKVFLSVPPEGYDPSARPSVLYVGKATRPLEIRCLFAYSAS
jgi:hypothetical protein